MAKTRDIREAVERELSRDLLLDADGITVVNVSGNVALNGTVPTYPKSLPAAETAGHVAGVTGVRNHLEVVLPPEDYRDDAMLTTAANNALAASGAVPEGVEATAKDGNLTLTGSVKYGSQRAAAKSAISALTDVLDVRDRLDLVFDVDPGEVNRLVSEALRRQTVPPDDSTAWCGHAVAAVIDDALQVTGLTARDDDV